MLADIYHARGLTCQQSPEGISSIFVDDFANFPHIFIHLTCGRMTSTPTIFGSFPTSECRKPLRSLFAP
jgi:hypothetical protein